MCNDAFVAGFFWGWLVTGATVLAALIYRRTRGVAPCGEAEFQVWMEDDVFCADAMGPRDQALAEARRYAVQYAQDGPVRIEEITRRVVERITAHSVMGNGNHSSCSETPPKDGKC